ncbi:MAG: carboxypeptidase regulatory-like domain-containing protein, partial [Candidatus Omnitrophica bacterium]|nr:carboxypeptidase regulatory-like domain-containing protein [Candidatus Omnitrophota bacterium]
YNHDGWSSAVVQEDGSINCSAPFNGNDRSDRICVEPGDVVDVVVTLVDVPTATISGKVTNLDTGAPLAGVDVRIRWHDGDNYPWPNKISDVTTDSNGNYLVTAPALQAIFPARDSYRVELSAKKSNVPLVFCCNEQTTISVTGYADPRYFDVFPGGTYIKNIKLDLTPQDISCGNAQGFVYDDSNGASISSASVELAGEDEGTSGSGRYVYACSEDSYFRLRTGNYDIEALHPRYYGFDSDGNDFYEEWNNSVRINADTVTNVNQIRLWPVGARGSIRVIVQDASADNNPIPNIEVELKGHDLKSGNSDFKSISPDRDTNASGEALFNNLLESWPPTSMPSSVKSRYNMDKEEYSVEVEETDAYQAATVTGIKLNSGENKTVTIRLNPKGAM